MNLKTAINKMREFPYFVMASMTVVVAETGEASAQNTVGTIANTLTNQVGSVGKLAVAGSFLGGVGFVAAGLMKLKQAADTQGQQVKYGEGLWRLAVGAGLVAVPAMTNTLTASMGLGNASVNNYSGF